MPFPTPPTTWVDDMCISAVASLAGLLGHLMRNANSRRKTTLKRSVLEAACSGLVGFLAVLLCRALGVSYEWTGFIAGVLGWLGATVSIQLFERLVRKKLGLNDVYNGGGEETGGESGGKPAADTAVPAGDKSAS